LSGACFSPDGKTLFVSVQHPAEDSESYDKPTTRWPDFADNLPPRPSVVAITHKDGLEIGA
jgi:secreted PhoX family phosphatase